jgi:hypothetical protein
MASSFASQIPIIIDIIRQIHPKTILDIGKGFGKYGFLIHEYVGIDNTRKLNPSISMKDHSDIRIDAVEVDPDLMLPHLNLFYNKIFEGDVLKIYQDLPSYDLVMMIDIIEHINKAEALRMLEYFLSKKSMVLIATPEKFFEQHLYESEFENHVSHWTVKDFSKLGYLNYQKVQAGMIYLVSANKVDYSGFGSGLIKKLKRIGWAIRHEL